MNSALTDEVISLNAIYGDGTLVAVESTQDVCILKLPEDYTSFRLSFPSTYPGEAPMVVGPESIAAQSRKGDAHKTTELLRRWLTESFVVGQPCMYDMVEYLYSLSKEHYDRGEVSGDVMYDENDKSEDAEPSNTHIVSKQVDPHWVLSEVVVEKKSVFVARAAMVSNPEQAQSFLRHLMLSDKKVAKATHNMTAWRMHDTSNTNITFQDCDDDGETAAGNRLLHLLQLMKLWNVMIVVTRWYGGVHLGPDRFRIINVTARDALVRLQDDIKSSGQPTGKWGRP